MDACEILYIPERLHSKDRPEIPNFKVGEKLFRRCSKENLESPFDGISLYDLSVNRQGDVDNPLSLIEDVLFNSIPGNGRGEKFDDSIIPLELKEVAECGTFEKEILHEGLDGENNPIVHTCVVKLFHDREPCNYSHCIFRLTLNNIIVTEINYKATFGKKSTSITQLRTKCKIEFEQMILRKEIWINDNH